jgi:hypothetical protein
MAFSLPSEPNLREDVARNLRIEAARLGLSSEAGNYRNIEIRAREAHLLAAVLGESKWYREHFDGLARIKSSFAYVGSILNRWMWGYGERLFVLLRNWVLATVVFFPVLFLTLRSEFHAPSTGVTFLSVLIYSLKNAVPAAISSDISSMGVPVTILAVVESMYSAVTLALVASYVFRWSLHR